MTNEDLQQLKALALAATPGPWERDTIRSDGEYGSDDDGGYGYDSYEVTDDKGRCIMDCLNNDDGAVHVGNDGGAWDEVAKRNTAYVAAASPDVILALIAKVESLAAPAVANAAPNAQLVEALQAICDMQKKHYGDGASTHINLIELTDKARAALASLPPQKEA